MGIYAPISTRCSLLPSNADTGAAGFERMDMKPEQIHRRLTFVLQAILLFEIAIALKEQQWPAAVISFGVILITLLPRFLARRYRIFIPHEFVILAIVFAFASLFLGEVHGYYTRFWWWDIALHAGSGFLLGIVGFLLVYVLNESEDIDVNMKPGFVALFAFLFSLGIAALWEVYEFGVDSVFGMNMQKEMLGDPSGLTDTMWDLIVDTLGALIIAILGYTYLKTGSKESFLERWIHAFIENNPRIFSHDGDENTTTTKVDKKDPV